jgi:hypothetical protein
MFAKEKCPREMYSADIRAKKDMKKNYFNK